MSDIHDEAGRLSENVSMLSYDLYEELEQDLFEFEEETEEAKNEVQYMIDQGWADEGYGSLVQREMEDSIMPKVEKALDDLQKELKSTVRDLLRKSR